MPTRHFYLGIGPTFQNGADRATVSCGPETSVGLPFLCIGSGETAREDEAVTPPPCRWQRRHDPYSDLGFTIERLRS